MEAGEEVVKIGGGRDGEGLGGEHKDALAGAALDDVLVFQHAQGSGDLGGRRKPGSARATEKGQYPSCQLSVSQRLDHVLNTGGVFERAWPMTFAPRDADKKRPDADKPPRKGAEGAVQLQ
ncbi:hypothetical protein AB0L74_26965 [Streptomyces sp. NPDC052020]|uniref:hypothetical protein n=1 Tax=Streptomyces sp. NPDC052020 TaxID=3155677 RepID=UPI0034313733